MPLTDRGEMMLQARLMVFVLQPTSEPIFCQQLLSTHILSNGMV